VLLYLAVLVSLALFLYELMTHSATILAPVIFFLIYEWHRYKNRQLLLRKQRGKKPPFVWPIRIKAFAPGLFDPDLFSKAARLMRRRQTGEAYRLDVAASVAATAAARGYPTFRYKLDTKPPEYLILIERASFRDHQARLFNELTTALEREGIFVARYFYDRDPRVCCAEAGGGCMSLPELHSKFPSHRLLVFGDGEKILDPVTGALASWTTVFSGWSDRALLTPAAPAEWGFREISVASLFIVLPASLAGLLTLVTHFESLTETDVRAWRARSTEKVPVLDAGPAAVIALKSYLGDSTFQWLCACAVYPELHWDLTLYFGSLSVMGGDLIREENLLRLIRLPWFRSGVIPDEVRWLLLRELDPARERAIRLALIEVLEHDAPPAETYAADAYQLNLVVQRWLSRAERERRRELLKALPATAQQQLTSDYTTLRFLEAEPLSALNVYLPPRLRRAFYQKGIAAFGLKTGARLLMVFLVMAIGFGARETRQFINKKVEASSTPTPTPTPMPFLPGMVYVPGGTFMMGRENGDDAERPPHQVTVNPFFIDRYEVTCEEYQKFVQATGSRPPSTWTRGVYPAGARLKPVTGVTWDEANAYAKWVKKRLPTEEEWEFAARGTDGRLYPWGNTWQAGLANANGASEAMAIVGSYQGTSPFGAYDMVGNAWEWTASNFRAYPGRGLPSGLPSGDLRAIRGGSYESTEDYATTTYRAGWPARGASTYDQTGIRCAADPADSAQGSAVVNSEEDLVQAEVAALQVEIRDLEDAARAELVGSGGARSGIGPRYRAKQNELARAKAKLDSLLSRVTLTRTPNSDLSTSFHKIPRHAALACSSCHQRAADNSIATSLPGHQACIGCHSSQFVTANASMCGLCHTQLASLKPPVNEFPSLQAFVTKFDHSRHSAGAALPANGCTTCHQVGGGKVVSTVRGLDAHTECYRCHIPVAQSNGRDIATCGVCHVLGAANSPK